MDPMTLSMLIGTGSSLLSGFMQKRAQKKAERTMQGYEADQVSTEGYDRLMERVSGADFDRSLYSGYQNMQRGAATQAQRMYSQMGNPALAAQAAQAERRNAQAGLFDALGENNLKRFGMLSNLQGAKSNVEVSNMQARNQARLNLMNQRAQMAQESPWANAVGAIGSIAMSGLSQRAGQQYADKTRMQDMEFFERMYGGANAVPVNTTQQFMQRRGMMASAPQPNATAPGYMPGQFNMGLLPRPQYGLINTTTRFK
jgi:hypothetical protein